MSAKYSEIWLFWFSERPSMSVCLFSIMFDNRSISTIVIAFEPEPTDDFGVDSRDDLELQSLAH